MAGPLRVHSCSILLHGPDKVRHRLFMDSQWFAMEGPRCGKGRYGGSMEHHGERHGAP